MLDLIWEVKKVIKQREIHVVFLVIGILFVYLLCMKTYTPIIPVEIAKAIKKAGYPQIMIDGTSVWWPNPETNNYEIAGYNSYAPERDKDSIVAPSVAEVLEWLEEKNIEVETHRLVDPVGEEAYECEIYVNNSLESWFNKRNYKLRNDALLAGIKESLKFIK